LARDQRTAKSSLRLEAALLIGRTAGNLCKALIVSMHHNCVPVTHNEATGFSQRWVNETITDDGYMY
jgi:hypothetical protein